MLQILAYFWAFSTISKVRLFWPFTITIFVISISLIHLRPNFTAKGLM